ncbi:MAG: hypothetical protein ACE1ZM_08970 [Gammaproteobacteria bacterium]
MGIAQINRSACYRWMGNGICGACLLGDKVISFEFAILQTRG